MCLNFGNILGILNPLHFETISMKLFKIYLLKEFKPPLSNAIFPICGDGVYLSPDISEAQDYSQDKHGICLNGKEYYIVFMCRVNPYKVRFVKKEYAKYWVVGGDSFKKGNKSSDEIRPYRILVKEMFDSLSDSNVED